MINCAGLLSTVFAISITILIITEYKSIDSTVSIKISGEASFTLIQIQHPLKNNTALAVDVSKTKKIGFRLRGGEQNKRLKTGSWWKWAIPLYLLSAQHCSLEGTVGKSQEKGGTIVRASCQLLRHLIVSNNPIFVLQLLCFQCNLSDSRQCPHNPSMCDKKGVYWHDKAVVLCSYSWEFDRNIHFTWTLWCSNNMTMRLT